MIMRGQLRIAVLTMVLLSTSLFMLFRIINKEPILGFYTYWNWKEVCIENKDTLKIPKRWDCFEEDNKTYIVDEQGNPVMIETTEYMYTDDWQNLEENNKFFSKKIRMKDLYGGGFSNSVFLQEVLIKDDEGERGEYVLIFPTEDYEEEYYFIVWDSEISKKMIEKVAWSFESGE